MKELKISTISNMMSSIDVASLTEKLHKNVCRDIIVQLYEGLLYFQKRVESILIEEDL
jgi:phage regulator Rha-like protein